MSPLDLTEAHQPFGSQLADLMERPASAPIADRYAAASDLTPDALLGIWRAIPTDKVEAIGVKLLGHYLAELVADDDGLISTEDERDAAAKQQQGDFEALFETVQAALPRMLWHYPEGYGYELRDAGGAIVEEFERFEDVPRAMQDAAEIGGRVVAVMPDGRHYPHEFLPISAP